MDRACSQHSAGPGYLGPDPAACCTQVDPSVHTEPSYGAPVKSQVLGSVPDASCRLKGLGISRTLITIRGGTGRLSSAFMSVNNGSGVGAALIKITVRGDVRWLLITEFCMCCRLSV